MEQYHLQPHNLFYLTNEVELLITFHYCVFGWFL